MTNAQFIRHGLYYLVFLLMFLTRGHQGFFIKHRQSGLCLYPKDRPEVYKDKKIYYVQFQEGKCLHSNAQFHFNNEELLINNGRNGTFLARRRYETRFHIYHGITVEGIAYPKKDRFVLKQTKFGSLSLYKDIERKYCAYPRNPTTLIGSYLIRSTRCHNEKQKFVFGSITDKGKSMTDVNCSPKQVMKVVKAEYGGFNNGIFYYNQDAICSLPSTCILKSQCDNKTSCNMNVNNELFKHDPCPGKAKKLYIEYVCVDSLTKPITKVFSADEIRFSPGRLPNKGYIQVLKDSVWQYVSDQNFERRKARDLCQFLGYFDLREVTIKSKRENFKLLSGDLTCRENSCCAHLYSSTHAEVKYKLPHFSCKICSEELKLKSKKFPSSSFTASTSYGYMARISSRGWCFTNLNTAYLQIDLLRDYVITKIATFGNKDGRKWTTSYSLKYSRDRNRLDIDGKIQDIKANTNGFGVAIHNLGKVHARYLKIIPDGEGCMRVELCGHELLPGPPINLQIVEINSRSFKISWEAPVMKGEGTISYLFTESMQNLFYKIEQRQLEKYLSGLKPSTIYSVKVSSKNYYGEGESAFKSFTTAAPYGPPLNVVFHSRSKTALTVSWNAPEKSVIRDGNFDRYKVCYSSSKNTEKCVDVKYTTSYIITRLLPATKYFVKVAAGTRIGFGYFSEEIINFTNQERVVPVKKTFSSLSLRLEKPQSNMIRSILVIVQARRTSTKTSDSYQTNELKPYSSRGSSNPYITAGFRYNNRPIDFIIGDGKPYSLNGISYVNQRLNEDTYYIVFVRFIETEEMYYSTEWSNYVRTYRKPPAPSVLKAISLSHRSLEISWKMPTLSQRNVKLSAFTVCYKEHNNGNEKCNKTEPSSSSINIDGLKSSTLYDIIIRSRTNIGDSVDETISKITNEKPIEVSKHTFNGFYIKLPQFKREVKTVYIIVKHGHGFHEIPDRYQSTDLKPFNKQRPLKPYITAEITTFTDFPQLFEVGNNSKYNNYHNKPLEQNETYFVFARIVINDKFYYSTDWTEAIIISALPPAPVIEKIVSYGKKALKISWKQPDLPEGQNVKSHVVTYWLAGNNSKERKLTNSDSTFYILRDLEYEKVYFITVETKSDTKTSKASKVASKKTNSEPLYVRVNIDNNYVISLRKSEEDITKVELIILQLQSNTTEPTPPDDIKLSTESPSTNQDKDIAFMAKSYNIGDFEDGNFDVILQLEKDKQRRKRASEPLKLLQRNYTFRFSQWNYNSSGRFSVSSWSEPIVIEPEAVNDESKDVTREGGTNSALAIGLSVVVVLIIIAVVIVGFIFWRRRYIKPERGIVYDNTREEVNNFPGSLDHNNGVVEANVCEGTNEGIYSNQAGVSSKEPHQPIPISEFAHYVNEMKANDKSEFKKEYDKLPTTSEASWDVSKKPDNKIRNRYGNIVTYDHSRVVLSGSEDEDYINASFIAGVIPNSYIACQGPTKMTLNDMWRMVWEQNSYSIVMVTCLTELGKPKCEKYWPDEGSEMFDKIQVTLVKTEEFAYYVTHTLQLKKGGEQREVKHYYFSSWPDHGVPKYPIQLLAFRKHMRVNHSQHSGPIIVHCSAGVGRTGVFLAIDMTLEKLEKGVVDKVDVFGQVLEMRGRRMNMIQTLEQYIFVHEAILETILCGMNEVNSSNIKQEMKKLTEVQAGGTTGFQEKFKRLDNISPKFSDEECSAGLLKGNETKNRSKTIYPAEFSRVGLKYIAGVANSDYINAVFVHGYLGKNYFIATQSPLPNTVHEFWRMVYEQNSSAIVLLNNVKEGTSFPKFWPTFRAQPKQYGNLTVQLQESATEKDGITTRLFLLSPDPDFRDGRVVNIFHYTKWPDHRTPESADVLLNLMSLVEKAKQNSGKAPVIVACSNGAGRTGTYIAISNLLERMKIEQAVDVFQAIKMIRSSRPQFVENAMQFKFCYEVVSAYLDSFDDYANFE